MVIEDIRERSRRTLAEHGLSISDDLPQIDVVGIRSTDKILRRFFCLHAIAATAYGFDRARARYWLLQEDLFDDLSAVELDFLERNRGRPDEFKTSVEGMWALAWVLNIVNELDFWRECESSFATILPNLKIAESVERITLQADARPVDQVAAACDLSYCIHWIIRESLIEGGQIPDGLKPYVVIERRRALEWALGEESWDVVSLDT